MKWDPSGQLLLTCAKEETVKLWASQSSGTGSGPGSGWRCLQSLPHPALVNGLAWCSLPGHGPKPYSMLATYVHPPQSTSLLYSFQTVHHYSLCIVFCFAMSRHVMTV